MLGKGLASLIPGVKNKETPGENRDRHLGISMVDVQKILTNPYQPRKNYDEKTLQELVQSIQGSGLIQPIVVRKNAKNQLELIAGERRLRAAQLAGLKQVPIVIRKSTDRESLELALIENIQREPLNCIDEALAYLQLLEDFSLTQEEIAERVGKDRTTIANFLRLLRLPEAIISDLRNQGLSFGHGKALLGLESVELQLEARKKILEGKRKLSVRETEELVQNLNQSLSLSFKEKKVNETSTQMQHLALELTQYWSTKVELRGHSQKGKIIFHYASLEELNRLIERMGLQSR